MRCALIVLLVAGWCAAQEESGGLKVWGALQNDLVGTQTFGADVRAPNDFAGQGIFTLNVRNRSGAAVDIEGSADLISFYGASGSAMLRDRLQPTARPFSGTESSLLFDLQKLFAGFFMRYGDLFIGRQVVTLGNGLVFSPIDVFSAVNVYDLSFKRGGSDVVRLCIPFGGLAAGAEFTGGRSAANRTALGAAKVFGSVRGVDVAAVALYKGDGNEVVTGLTARGNLGAELYGELAEHFDVHGNPLNFSGMMGAEYRVADALIVNGEFLYTQKAATAARALSPLPSIDSATGMPPVGANELFLSARHPFADLSSVGLSAIGNLDKGLGFITAQYSRRIVQNANMTLYARYLHFRGAGAGGDIPDLQYGLRMEAAF